ncbi:MAG: dihydroorotase [Actinobacteria bacterium]|nr:dihydroorotase [Actinomycetota bacterium]
MELLIKGGKLVDPSNKQNSVKDIYIKDGLIKSVGKDLGETLKKGINAIDAKGLIVAPGFVDLHTHLREPGREDEETIATGTRAAAKGGFTSICCMPNTNPVVDNKSVVDFIKEKARSEGIVKVFPVGAITKGLNGRELAEMADLADAGVVGFSDDGESVMDSRLMRRALEYSKMFDLPLMVHSEDKNLTRDGQINEGYWSTALGLKGMPSQAEEIMVARDISLLSLTGGRIHIAHTSASESVDIIRKAKNDGLKVTCEATPHHLTLNDEYLRNFDTSGKVNPPLRSKKDIEALIEALADGTIDVVATDHAPHTLSEKEKEFDLAPFGVIGLETAFSVLFTELVKKKLLSFSGLIEALSTKPASIIGVKSGIKEGSPADLTVIDEKRKFKVEDFISKSSNSPFKGRELEGKVIYTIVDGKVVFEE